MKAGDEIQCKECGNESFIISKTKMEGWKVLGEYFACASCGATIKGSDSNNKEQQSNTKIDKNISDLADFLNTKIEEKKTLTANGSETHFCRDCAYYIKHPFLTRCELHKKEVAPMDDCSNFKQI